MQKRTLKVAVLAALAIILVLSFSSVALADQTWTDMPDTVTAKYGITDNQVASISEGYGSLWKPYQAINRAQFTKMAVAAFGINLANPATASFTDVPKNDFYYQYIEGAKAAGVINGTTATTFSPKAMITRQQALAIVSRYVAMANGYNLATMYTATEIDHILAHFGDAASISADLKDEVAFAYDMGLTKGDAYGNVAPLANLMRIQAAAFLIRAQELVPPANYTPAKIELVSADKTENLIGKVHQATFKVTDAAGHPAAGVLVDFDTMFANPLYVGNISPEAAVTNNMGEVTVQMLSAEPGTQRISAAVAGLTAIYTTKYWVAMDEIYILDTVREAENNAGDAHEWAARVVVIGPGPRSTSQFDWYNAIDAAYDPANLHVNDGVWYALNDYADELELRAEAWGWVPRTMAGIGVQWSIIPVSATVPSVGDIVEVDGAAITAAKTALGSTDADGVSTISINSTATGKTVVQAIATYPENPYPQMLFSRGTADPEDWVADADWEQQPKAVATATKTWIPHVIGGDSDAPITPAYAVNNTGEVEEFTLELKDVYGNAIPDYTVLWWIQGVGEFKTDDSSWSGIGEQNKDWDETDAAGKASVWVKSLIPGQTIVHCKVMDKYGLPYKEWNVVKQWYSIDDVSFVDPAEENPVNTGHTFDLQVSGAKLVHVLYDVNRNALMDDQALLTTRAELAAYDATATLYVAKIVNNVLGWVDNAGAPIEAGKVYSTSSAWNGVYYTAFAHVVLEGAEFWTDSQLDGIDEVWSGLQGKTVYFFNNIGACAAMEGILQPTSLLKAGDSMYGVKSNTAIPTEVSGSGWPMYVGSITSALQVVTDADGMASVSINSVNKGFQFVWAVADYTNNPQDGDPLMPLLWDELRSDCAVKLWTADGFDSIKIFAAGDPNLEGLRWVNPVLDWAGYDLTEGQVDVEDETNLNTERIAVQVFDQYGNALEGYKVTWEVLGQNTTTAGAEPTYHPYAHLTAPAHDDPIGAGVAGVGDRNPSLDSNAIWDRGTTDGQLDDDYAWGWTLNHQINFTLSDLSAAYVDLVLDETAGQLAASGAAHYTNIININVYTPGGAHIGHYEVTKVWDVTPPALTSIVTSVSTTGADGTWVAAQPATTATPIFYKVELFDQYGDPYTGAATDLRIRFANAAWGTAYVALTTPDADGVITGSYVPAAVGQYNVVAFDDTVDDDLLNAGELQSNLATYILQ